MILGEGEYRYRVNVDWAKLPPGWFHHDVSSIAVDEKDQVYVFARSEHPVTIFDRDGNFLNSWGEGQFLRPHGIFLAPDGTVFLTDDGTHSVRQFDRDGRLLMTIGEQGKSSPFMSGEPFNRCTNVALSPQGDIYVTDGYNNARVHKFDPSGRHLFSWGGPGTNPGEFNVVHHISCDSDGYVYVADRENHRIQIFDGEGKYQSQWNNLHRPCGMYMTEDRDKKKLFYVGENPAGMEVNIKWPNLGPRVSILDGDGNILARIGTCKISYEPGNFLSAHAVAADSKQDIYVGEVATNSWPKYYTGKAPPDLKCLQKLERVT